MQVYYLRILATGCVVLWILGRTVSVVMSYHGDSRYLLWGAPIIMLNILNLYFLFQSIQQDPKGVDSRWSTFLISTGATLTLGFTSFFIGYPLLEIPYATQIKQMGIMLAFIPYPFVVWALLCLNNCLTVLPEAHAVVARGIYKYSRHPLYMCYIIWAISNMLMFPSLPIIALSILEISLQLLRIKREEALLLETFPEYRSYWERTGLIGRRRIS